MFFHKNKRKSAFCTKRIAFCALFLFAILGTSVVSFIILNVDAQDVPVKSVEITSEHTSFENAEPGAWKITKSAKWTKTGKARITFEIDSVKKVNPLENLDVLLVLDNSGSMAGAKLDQVQTDVTELINAMFDESNNRIAMISFDSEVFDSLNFTTSRNEVTQYINGMLAAGETNYYKAYLAAERLLEDYTPEPNRQLIMLFLTDGMPNNDTPNEISVYRTLKTKYPNMRITGIQYEYGETIFRPIVDVSDDQYLANRVTLRNVLFDAVQMAYRYNNFVINDYLNDTYWSISDIGSIVASDGIINLEYEGETPKIVWDLSNIYRSGDHARLAIDVNLKEDFLDANNLLLPTNIHETIQTNLENTQDEEIDSSLTPILKDTYTVTYNANLPQGCEVSGIIPEAENHSILSSVELHSNQLYCDGYNFHGWQIATAGVSMLNDDFFRMPESDVEIIATWTKVSISKSMDGIIHKNSVAIFDKGPIVNEKIKNMPIAQGNNSYYSDNDYYIRTIVRSNTAPSYAIMNNSAHLLSAPKSSCPIYGWYQSNTLYYYTDAAEIYLNEDSSHMFEKLGSLSNISALSEWNTVNTRDMSYMFYYATALTNVSAISSWNTHSVRDMSYMFYYDYNLEDISGLTEWDTSNVKNMAKMFYYANKLSDIDALRGWNVSKVENMSGMFYYVYNLTNLNALEEWDVSNLKDASSMFCNLKNLTDISALANWETPSLEDTSHMFYLTRITNVDALSDWDVSHVTTMYSMFGDVTTITDISGVREWNTSSVKDISFIVGNNPSLVDISAVRNWDTSNVEKMWCAFCDTGITNVDALEEWDVSKVWYMSNLFSGDSSLTNINGLRNWNTSSVTEMYQTFYDTGITNVDALLNWDVSHVTTLERTFCGAERLYNINGLRNWDVSNVKTMSQLFSHAFNLSNIEGVRNWKTTSLENMDSLFTYNYYIRDISPIANWDTSHVTTMQSAFLHLHYVTSLDSFAGWDVSNVKEMGSLFSCMYQLSNINGIRNWNISSATDISSLFSSSRSLSDLSPISDWDTSKITDISGMFYGLTALTNLNDLSEWDVSNVTDLSYIFANDPALTDISGIREWNISSVKDLSGIFNGDSSLSDISPLADWNTSSVTTIQKSFYSASSITDLSPLENWNTTNITNKSDAFYGIPSSVSRPTWY